MTVMGMAASQARFLGLTARKSNVEYQGQQVNQQRTALANESANLYNQMVELTVPTPPSQSDFIKTTYVLEDSGDSYQSSDYEIANLTKTYDAQGQYMVSLKRATEIEKTTTNSFIYSGKTSSSNGLGGTTTTIRLKERNGSKMTFLNYVQDKDNKMPSAYLEDNSMEISPYQIYEIDKTKTLPNGYDLCSKEMELEQDEKVYFYQDGNGVNSFLTQKQLDALLNNDETSQTDDDLAFHTTYTYTKDTVTQVKAYLEESDNGRYTTIQIEDNEDYSNKLRGRTFTLSVSQTSDETAYEQAMRDYEYNKDVYEKTIADINAQTKAIQSKDQKLELRLQQLDTEQQAISTEMESVTKVLEGNIEKTFNAFG